MPPTDVKFRSKLLSLILRHEPEKAGLTLGPGGWAQIDDLLKGLAALGKPLTREQLHAVVETNDKKRFTISDDGQRIRAAQGHSVNIAHDLPPTTPPPVLFHGTARRALAAIMAEGLKPQSRLHVHLSPDVATAVKVGARHGAPVVLSVAAEEMAAGEFVFYRADNGVWLTDHVPARFLSVAEEN